MGNIIKMKSNKSKSVMLFIAALQCLFLCSALSAPMYHLPSTVTPLNYILQLQPDLDSSNVTGVVMITLLTTSNLSTPTKSMEFIMLHLGEDSSVNESEVLLMDSTGVTVPNLSFVYNNDDTTLKVKLPTGSSLAFNTIYMMSLPFSSPLYSEPKGLFTGSYNTTSMYIASAFQPTFARNVFPCFDEPQFQVPLTLRVIRPSSYSVLFTTALSSSSNYSDDGDYMLDIFEQTENVSLSSLGLFMSEMTPLSDGNLSFYLPEEYHATNPDWDYFVANITSVLGPLPTTNSLLNVIVLPDLLYTSFSSLGFVFTTPEVYYRNVSAVLQGQELYQQLAEAYLQQYLAFTHTPEWWSDIWLSQSIAAYLANMMLPQITVEGWQITEIRSKGFNNEFYSCSGPVVDDQLKAKLDIEAAISNQTMKNKGLAVLEMWDKVLPEGVILQSVVEFINMNKSLTTTMDFLAILTAQTLSSNSTIPTDGLSNWLTMNGYPIVTVELQNSSQIVLSQKSSCPNDTTMWPIYISYTDVNSANWSSVQQGLWLVESNFTISLASNTSDWIVFNLENAPYRTNYKNSYEHVLSALKANSSSIPVAVKASLQSDAVALALSGSLNFTTALQVLQNTQHEQVDWLPVTSAFNSFTSLIGNDTTSLTDFIMYAERLFSSELLAAVDLRNTTNNNNEWLVRSLLTPWLCRFNISDCRLTAVELAEQLLSNMGTTHQTDPNDVDNIVCQAARYNTSVFDVVLSSYATTSELAGKRLLTMAMGCVIDSESVQKVLNTISGSSSSAATMTEVEVDNSALFTTLETRDILVGLASSVENADTLVNFITSEALTLQSMIGSSYLSDVIKTLGQLNVNLTKLQTLEESTKLSDYVVQSALQSINKSSISSSWWSENGQSFVSDLAGNSSTTTPTTTGSTTTTTKIKTTIPTTNTAPITDTTQTPLPTSASSASLPFIKTVPFHLITAVLLLVLISNV